MLKRNCRGVCVSFFLTTFAVSFKLAGVFRQIFCTKAYHNPKAMLRQLLLRLDGAVLLALEAILHLKVGNRKERGGVLLC